LAVAEDARPCGWNFAPIVSYEGDADFPLKGGAVGYFLDRKAAVLVYARQSSLGYALVSDVDRREFASLAAKLQSMP